MSRTFSISFIAFFCLAVTGRALADSSPPDFDRDVATIFAGRCFDCHNPTDHKGGLDLTHKSTAMAGGENGAVIAPGKPDESVLWKQISTDEMPPKHPLPAGEKEILRRWIAGGATWGTDPIDPFRVTTAKRAGRDWWSLQPVHRPSPPAVTDEKWVRNPVDRFILRKLHAEGLKPSPEADRRTLIRRLTVDLTGLPPTPEQVDAFVRHDRPDAYERLVDRLLDSPDYGVRAARQWLVLARFGESNGCERDQLRPNAWRYRDWVVNAFNADMPYDRFARMQLAGDVLAPESAEGIAATGFLVAAAYDQVGNTQQSAAMRAVVRQDELEDLTSVVGQTFLGLTVNCARCHDHKFDPISQKEYYQLAASLAGVKHGERQLPTSPTSQPAAPPAYFEQLLTSEQRLQQQISDVEMSAIARHAKDKPRQAIVVPKPIAAWDFRKGIEPSIGKLQLKRVGSAQIADGALQLDGKGFATSEPLPFNLREKTLDVDLNIANVEQRGGGAFGVQTLDGVVFDSVVFGEREQHRWMAGSDYFHRSRPLVGARDEAGGAVRVAITYAADGTISVYRNGLPYGDPYRPMQEVTSFDAGKSQILLGLRHSPAENGKYFIGSIREARLYDRALSAAQIAAAAGVDPASSEAGILANLSEEERARRGELLNELSAVRRALVRAKTDKTYACVPVATPEPTHVLNRGNPAKPGEVVPPAGIAALVGVSADFGLPLDAPDADRRRKLAEWMTDPSNPLFARVMVNRLWQSHFGVGLVDTPSDFGFNGGRPTHPELLDWLASELPARGWSLKQIQRLIVTSATYRQSSLVREDAMKLDASNRFLWRMPPRRIEGEVLRDTVLSVAGELNPLLGGPGYEDFYTFTNNSTFYEPRDYVGETFNRRSLYRTWVRSGRSPLLDVFDCPDPSTKTPRRAVTTTPLQALSLMNNSMMLRMSERLAERAKRQAGEDAAKQIVHVYELTLLRRPTAEESEEAAAFVRKHDLAAFCRVILNSSEFVCVD
jgi:hypothetical protein